MRLLGLATTLVMVGSSGGSLRASAPLPGAAVAAGLAEVVELPGAQALARLMAFLPHGDALPPEALVAALRAIGASTTPAAPRARFELAGLATSDDPRAAPDISALAVAELLADGTLSDAHRRLVARRHARANDPYDGDLPAHRWRPLRTVDRGSLVLDALAPDRSRFVFHAAVPLVVAARFEGRLMLGATGEVAVSLAHPAGGRFLGAARGLSRAEPDQLEIPIALDAGDHLLLFTLRPNAGEPARLRLRFDAPGGAVPTSTLEAAPALSWPSFQVPDDPVPLPWSTAVRTLLRARGNDLAGLVLARRLGLPDRAVAGARGASPILEERLAAANLPALEFLLALDAVRRPEDRASLLLARLDRRRCRGCARDPQLLVALAEHTATRGQLVQAGVLLDEAERADPDGTFAGVLRFARARLARLAGAPEEVLIAYRVGGAGLGAGDIAAQLGTTSARARREVAEAALELGRADVAKAIVDGLVSATPARLELGLRQIRVALAAGAADEAVSRAIALADAHPTESTLALRAAERLLQRGAADDTLRARILIERALDTLRWKTDGLVDAGHLLEDLGDRGAAADVYARALAVSPAHEDARRHLERLQGAEPVPLMLTLSSVLDAPVVDADASFEVLGEERYVKVREDGSATHWIRRILRAQTVPEARAARTLVIPFDPTQQSVRVLAATVRRAVDGRVDPTTLAEPVAERVLETVGEQWYGLYYDLRRLSIPFDHLARGDIIEVTWRIDPVGQLFPGVLDLFEVLADRVPKHLHRVIVETPAGMTLDTRLARPDGLVFEAVEKRLPLASGVVRYVIEARGIPGVPIERLAPGTAEVSPVWQATTFGTWREVATWYRRLVEPQKVLTPAMRAFVSEARRGGAATPGEILARLAAYVTQEIRYVGLEFGIHGYKPYRTDHVWARRFGDCKDKATLLSALLNEAGIGAEVALVRTRKQGRLPGALPSLSLFDHAAVYLRPRGELVDPTATHFGPEELPREDQGAQILVLMPPDEEVDLALSRVDPPSRNGVVGTYSVTLERRGGAGIQGVVSFLGMQAPPYRALLLDPASQRVRLTELMNQRFPGLTLRDFRVSDPRDRRRPFELVFHAHVPRFGQLTSGPDGTLQVLHPTGVDGHRDRFAREDSRSLPLVLGPPMSWDVTYRYILPEGHRVERLPPGGERSGPYGSYRVSWHDEGGAVAVRTQISYRVDQVSAADYPRVRDFVRAFDELVATPLVLSREDDAAAGPPEER